MATESNDEALRTLVTEIADILLQHKAMLVTAESCTGGWVAKVCTDLGGSSHWFERGFVTYSNPAKEGLLGVSRETLVEHGAVSEAVVVEMACGALKASDADIAVAISGIAGPEGGTPDKPVGTVWFAWALSGGEMWSRCCLFEGGRKAVRYQAVARALRGVIDVFGEKRQG